MKREDFIVGLRSPIALLALLLAACGQPAAPAPAPSAAAAADCNKTASRTVAFTAPDAQDVVETRSIGADCKSAFVMISVRKASGEPLWAWASANPWPGDRGVNGSANAPGAMDDFLKGWANVKIDTTAALPDWPQRANVFKDDLGAFMHTPLDRAQYIDVRAKALPRLCHATGIESGLCIYYDPASGSVIEVFQSGA
jgi:hypothetical protein